MITLSKRVHVSELGACVIFAAGEANIPPKSCKGYTAHTCNGGPWCERLEQADTGISLRSLGKRLRTYTQPGLHDLEKEKVRMIAFLLTFGLAALLVVGGMKVSLRLRAPDIPTGQRLRGLRRSYAAPMNYKHTKYNSASEDEMSRYVRKACVILILVLVMLSVIIINAIGSVLH
jgi:hypothetical protein